MILQGKVAVVTGVSKGIGKALTEQLLEKGCKVAGLGRNQPDISNPDFIFYKTDVRDFDQVNAAITNAVLDFGSDIHVLINNAGLGYFGYLENHTIEQWDEMFQTNVNGVFYTCKEIIPLMKKTGSGHIINIASTAGLEGYPQVSGYCGTKHAVKGISDALYKELREFKIKVTCVYPGSTKTDFFRNSPGIKPHDYMLQPEDVAAMMVHALETPDNFHQVNLEVRPLQPKGPK
jgi:NADP-dependent 3-hydroxy acid dehydrogenase YdfG